MSVIDFIFKVGDKVTKGDPKRQADFIYYMMWVLFTSFFAIFVSNLYYFFAGKGVDKLAWAGIGFAITSIQYFSLKQMYEQRRVYQKQKPIETIEDLESVDEMLQAFNSKKGGENNVQEKKERRTRSSKTTKSNS